MQIYFNRHIIVESFFLNPRFLYSAFVPHYNSFIEIITPLSKCPSLLNWIFIASFLHSSALKEILYSYNFTYPNLLGKILTLSKARSEKRNSYTTRPYTISPTVLPGNTTNRETQTNTETSSKCNDKINFAIPLGHTHRVNKYYLDTAVKRANLCKMYNKVSLEDGILLFMFVLIKQCECELLVGDYKELH